ncbi:hypothetical protein LC065_07865 [Halobacillus litoralis]|nr:hypothetical protein [Halobacillus litoralis]WLR49066.1 hypothetical protein LC065_07865 [Halobacillus litoralis]
MDESCSKYLVQESIFILVILVITNIQKNRRRDGGASEDIK